MGQVKKSVARRDAKYPAYSPGTYLSFRLNRKHLRGRVSLSSTLRPDLLLLILDFRKPSLVLIFLILLLFHDFGVSRGQCAKLVLLFVLVLRIRSPTRTKSNAFWK